MARVSAEVLVPAPAEQCKEITGQPEGSCINFVSWSPKGGSVAFTTCSMGGPFDPPRGPLQLWVADATTATARPALVDAQQRLNTTFCT
jgi:hypothetical protein